MNIAFQIDGPICLRDYSPLQIVNLHKKGLITCGDIIESGRHISEFGNIIKDYLDWYISTQETVVIDIREVG